MEDLIQISQKAYGQAVTEEEEEEDDDDIRGPKNWVAGASPHCHRGLSDPLETQHALPACVTMLI